MNNIIINIFKFCDNLNQYTCFDDIEEDIVSIGTDANYLPTSEDLHMCITHICETVNHAEGDIANRIWMTIKSKIQEYRRELMHRRIGQLVGEEI